MDQSGQPNSLKLDNERLKLHIRYILILTVLTISCALVWTISGNEDAQDYLSVGVTFSSLILAIIAIIYNFIAGSRESEILGQVRQVSARLEKASDDIVGVSNKIVSQSSNIPRAITDTLGKLNLTRVQNNEEFEDFNYAQNNDFGGVDVHQLMQNIVREASSLGYSTLFFLKEVHEKRIAFDYHTMASVISGAENDYVYGWYDSTVALGAVSILNLDSDEESYNKRFVVNDMHPTLKEAIAESLSNQSSETVRKTDEIFRKLSHVS